MVKTMSSRRDTNPPAIYDEMWDFSFIILSHSGFEFAISLNGTACLTSWKKEKNLKISFHFLKWYFVTKIVMTYCEKKCSSDREKLLKFEAKGQELALLLWSLEQFFQRVKGQKLFLVT